MVRKRYISFEISYMTPNVSIPVNAEESADDLTSPTLLESLNTQGTSSAKDLIDATAVITAAVAAKIAVLFIFTPFQSEDAFRMA